MSFDADFAAANDLLAEAFGEQVTLRIYAYGGRGSFSVGFVTQPSTPDFLSYPIEQDDLVPHRVPIGGQVFHAAKLREVALIPLKTGQLEIDSSEFLCQSFTFTLKNNLRPVFSLDAGVVGSMRCPDAIVPGIMEVSLSAEVRDESGIDLMADRPAAIQFHFAAGNGSGRTLVIDTSSSAGLNPTSAPVRFVGGSDDVTYAIEAEANHNDLNAWGVSVG